MPVSLDAAVNCTLNKVSVDSVATNFVVPSPPSDTDGVAVDLATEDVCRLGIGTLKDGMDDKGLTCSPDVVVLLYTDGDG